MAKKIELTELELKVLIMDVNREFPELTASQEERDAESRVIDMAWDLMHELNAIEESGSDVMKWFYNKYLEQEKIENKIEEEDNEDDGIIAIS